MIASSQTSQNWGKKEKNEYLAKFDNILEK
jgi:hypothetical protein